MSRPVAMSKRVQWKDSKAERKAERQKVGRLEDQRISPATANRYRDSLKEVAEFAGLQTAELLQRGDIDDLLSSYIELLWEDGETKTKGNYAVAAVQFQKPSLKHHLHRSWKLLALWNKIEQPRRATPMDCSMVLAFAGIFHRWKWPDLACLIVVGFCGLLRTAEMFQLRRDSVVLPRRAGQPAILFLVDTKTTKRNLLDSEKVMITEKTAIECLHYLCRHKQGPTKLVDVTPVKFRELWREVVKYLQLDGLHYLPYSLRRGGATCAHREGLSFEKLLTKGRWQNIATARTYVDQALQEFALIQLPPTSLPLIRAAKNTFKAAGLGRVEGEARGRLV